MPKYKASQQHKIQARAMGAAIDMYVRYFQKILGCYAGDGNQVKKKWTEGHHPFIPSYDTAAVISCLRLVRDYLADKQSGRLCRATRLLDCGCGVGNILLLARGLGGFNTTGLEYEPEACAIAKLLVPSSEILCQDILTFEHYADYDVIYYYHPICDNKKMRLFIEKMYNDMRVGAVVTTYGGGASDLEYDKSKRFKAIFARFKSIPEDIRRMAWEKVKE